MSGIDDSLRGFGFGSGDVRDCNGNTIGRWFATIDAGGEPR